MAQNKIKIADLNASGSPSSTTFLRGDNTWSTPAGGGGSPGGSDTQVQFNDGGSFGGDASFTWDKTNNVLNLDVTSDNPPIQITTDGSIVDIGAIKVWDKTTNGNDKAFSAGYGASSFTYGLDIYTNGYVDSVKYNGTAFDCHVMGSDTIGFNAGRAALGGASSATTGLFTASSATNDSNLYGLFTNMGTTNVGGVLLKGTGGSSGGVTSNHLTIWGNTASNANHGISIGNGTSFTQKFYVRNDGVLHSESSGSFVGALTASNLSGTNTGDQTITLSGDITGSGTTGITTTIAAGAVDIAMLSATGSPSSSTYLRGDNTWATVSGGGSFGTDNQIPFTNAGGTDFDYSANLTFDGTYVRMTNPGTNVSTLIVGTGGGSTNAIVLTTSDYSTTIGGIGFASNIAANAFHIAATNRPVVIHNNGVGGLYLVSAATTYLQGGAAVVINEYGTDTDLRVESDIDTNAFFLDGANSEITIGGYGSGSITGTATYNLAVDSTGKIIEVATGGGSGATTALDNLASVAINTSLISDTNNTDDLGSTGIRWKKTWTVDLESTNMPTVGGTSLSSTFSPIAGSASITTVGTIGTGTWQGTAIGDTYISSAATWNAKQSAITFGTGVQTALGVNIGSAGAPILFNGAGGTPSSMVGTNITGTASGLTAGAVTGFTAGAGTLTGPASSGVAVTLGNNETITGVKTMSGLNSVLVSSSGLTVRNPANTFKYTITGAAIAADRQLNLPLITGTATLAVLSLAQTYTATQTFTSPVTTTSITTGSTSFTAWAGATTLLTIGGTGASASLFAPSTLDTSSSTTGAIRTSGGISAAKALNIGTTITAGSTINATTGYKVAGGAASRKVLVGDGTNFVASTETYATPGASGNVMTSDGTNWTSAAPAGGGDVLALTSDPTTFYTTMYPLLTGSTFGYISATNVTFNGQIQWGEMNFSSTNGSFRFVMSGIDGSSLDNSAYNDATTRRISFRLKIPSSGNTFFGFASTDASAYYSNMNATHGDRIGFSFESGTVRTMTDTGGGITTNTVTVTNTNWNLYEIVYDQTVPNVKFYLNKTLIYTHTTNVPSSSGSAMYWGAGSSNAKTLTVANITYSQKR